MGVQEVPVYTTADLPAGVAATSVAVMPIPVDIPANTTIGIGYGLLAPPLIVTTNQKANAGDTLLRFASVIPTIDYPPNTGSQTLGLRYEVLNRASGAVTVAGDTGQLSIGMADHINCGINVSALSGTTPGITFFLDVLGQDGQWYQIWTSNAITAIGKTGTSVGDGMATNQFPTSQIRLRWTVQGTTPSITFTAFITGK